MPLLLIDIGTKARIKSIGGLPRVRKHLEDLGFVEGAEITVVTKTSSGLIVSIDEDTRVALDSSLA